MKRHAVLSAALELFAQRGFHGTAVPEIAGLAGVGLGTIYRHFPSKEALVNAVYQQCKLELVGSIVDGFPFYAPPREQFHAFWTRLTAFAKDNPQVIGFVELHYHASYLGEKSLELERQGVDLALAFFRRTTTDGVTRDLPPEALVAIVWGAFVGLIKAERLGYLEITDDLVQSTEQSCWDAVRRHPRGQEDSAP